MAKKKPSTAQPLPKTITVKNSNGTNSHFEKKSCSKLKTDARKMQDNLHEKGIRAILKKDPVLGTTCVFEGPKMKANAVGKVGKSKTRKVGKTTARKVAVRSKRRK